jgi:hypothetical protein
MDIVGGMDGRNEKKRMSLGYVHDVHEDYLS